MHNRIEIETVNAVVTAILDHTLELSIAQRVQEARTHLRGWLRQSDQDHRLARARLAMLKLALDRLRPLMGIEQQLQTLDTYIRQETYHDDQNP